MPSGVRALRSMLHATAVEVLLYLTPVHCQDMLDSLTMSLNATFTNFMKRNPTFKVGLCRPRFMPVRRSLSIRSLLPLRQTPFMFSNFSHLGCKCSVQACLLNALLQLHLSLLCMDALSSLCSCQILPCHAVLVPNLSGQLKTRRSCCISTVKDGSSSRNRTPHARSRHQTPVI